MKARHLISVLAAASVSAASINALASEAAAASVTPAAKPPFPVKLETIAVKGKSSTDGGLVLTWRSVVPGLSYCVAYAATHGASFHGWLGGRDHQWDREHCLTAGRDGTVTDTVPVEVSDPAQTPDALLIANVVLVDNEVSTETIPLQKFFGNLHR